MAKKKSLVELRRKRYFGIVRLPAKVRVAWISKEDKNGWSLGLALNARTVWVKGLRFRTADEVSRAIDSKIVFVNKNK